MVVCGCQVNGVDVTSARHDQVIRLLTSDCSQFTIVVYRDPSHPLSPTSSLFKPFQPPISMTLDSSRHPSPQLCMSTTVTSPTTAAVSFASRPTSAEAGKFALAVDAGKSRLSADAGKSPSPAVKTVTYSIGDSASVGVEPPMPVMRLGHAPRGSSGEPVMRITHNVPCNDANLLFATPPAPPRTSTGSGLNDLFDALEKTYQASQQGRSDDSRGTRSSAVVAPGSSQSTVDKKRHSVDVRLSFGC